MCDEKWRASKVHDGRLQLKVQHFHCGCGQVHNDYLVPADEPDRSSWSLDEILKTLKLRPGDVIEIRRVEKGAEPQCKQCMGKKHG